MGACSHALLHFLRERRRRGDEDEDVGRRCWRSFVFHTCFTHTHSHTRTHAHTLAYPHAYRYKKKRLEVCNSTLGPTWSHVSWQLPIATIFQLRLIGMRLRPQLNLLTKPRETEREREQHPRRVAHCGFGFVRLVASKATIGRSPTTSTFSRNHSLWSSRSLAAMLSLLSARTFYKQAVAR